VSARQRTSSDDQRVSVELPSSLKQRLLDGTDNNPNRRLGLDSSLQIGNALTRLLPFLRLNLFVEVQLNGQIGSMD
jgi:hypothetical protein